MGPESLESQAEFLPEGKKNMSTNSGLAEIRAALLQWYPTSYAVGTDPCSLAFDGANIWVTNYGSSGSGSTVTKLAASTGALVDTYEVQQGPRGIAFDGTNMWVANDGESSVSKLLASTGGTVGHVPGWHQPLGSCFRRRQHLGHELGR